ncbi:MAG TPA: hypothetical protein VII05_06945 [Gaiellaceae bacterium]
MLAALSSSAIAEIVLSIVLACFLAGRLIRRPAANSAVVAHRP